VHVVSPEEGRLAGGDVGAGRLADPAAIVAAAARVLSGRPSAGSMAGLSVLVTAGGTREPIDPVRFIGNRSSGKQGHALAEEAAARGATVTLVTTTGLPVPVGIERVPVATAAEMHRAVEARAGSVDVVVMAAAVADFTPVHVAEDKLKKRDGVPVVELEPTVDILAGLGANKSPGQTLVGFAAETTDVAEHAAAKLAAKRVDLLVANDVSAPGVGFEHDTNEVLILHPGGEQHHVPLSDKRSVARAVLDAVVAIRSTDSTQTGR
jgi:phosphopantothenoylcysteine decarboxylase/phosphopantothenate--cysteine ligase